MQVPTMEKVFRARGRHWYAMVLVIFAVEFLMAIVGHRFRIVQTNPFVGALVAAPAVIFLLYFVVIRPVEKEMLERSSAILATINERHALELVHAREREAIEARYRSVVEDLTEMVVRRMATGEVSFANSAFLETFDLKLAEIVSRPFPVVIFPADRGVVEEKLRELGTTSPLVRVWHRVETAKGTRWQNWTHRAILGSAGEVTEIQSVGTDITDMRAVQDQIANSRTELRELAHRLFSIHEDERRVFAREIHDGLCQSLTALSFQFAFFRQNLRLPAGPLREEADEINRLLESIIGDARTLSRRIRPGILDDLGLGDAIRAEARQFTQKTGIPCVVRAFEEACPLESGPRAALFRIVQEALANVESHAAASKVTVELRNTGSDLVLEIEDNGRGIPAEKISHPHSLGLLGMRERSLAFQGSFAIAPGENGGTKVSVEIPLPAEEGDK